MTLDPLLREIRACTLCADALPHGPRPVLQASESSRILIAGQAPGRRVHESGVPFQDPSGDRLRDWLGISEADFYDPALIAIVPMGFCFPGTGSSGDKPPRKECAPAWRERVLDELSGVRLTIVLGAHAQRYHLPGTTSLTDAVARWRDFWPELLPLPHPSPRNQAWFKKHPWFIDEVLPVLKERVAQLTAARSD